MYNILNENFLFKMILMHVFTPILCVFERSIIYSSILVYAFSELARALYFPTDIYRIWGKLDFGS